eukprot:gb/GECG01002515.1/.p1 GENE.gb/GECG01002515.1/~~gb/GECG01002515.1/.p1  ORF type:complete len:1183 (+),score=122.67 gb/GECG01002515.1/:1-3549(+)
MDARVETTANDRLADYFLVVGPSETLTPVPDTSGYSPPGASANQSLWCPDGVETEQGASEETSGSVAEAGGTNTSSQEATSWNRRVHPLQTQFQAFVLDRYPFADYANSPFPTNAPMFCFPRGVRLKRPNSSTFPLPTFFTFALSTNHDGQFTYGHTLIFWEELSSSQSRFIDINAAGGHDGGPIYAPKGFCILSKWNFSGFRWFLTELYRLTFTALEIPLERYIGNFMTEVPLPPPGLQEVQYNIAHSTISFRRPPANNRISPMDYHFQEVFECLSLENIVLLVRALVCERQVLLHTSQVSLLSKTTEALVAFIYPFRWVGVYIPVMTRAMLQVVNAPVPFLVGAPTDTWREIGELPDSVIQVDLDRNSVFVHYQHPVAKLPSKQHAKLIKALRARAYVFANRQSDWERNRLPFFDMAFPYCPRPCDVGDNESDPPKISDTDWYEVRASFLRLWLSLFINYRRFLVPISRENPNPKERFRSEAFLSHCSADSQPILRGIMSTQLFHSFIDERTNPDTMGNVDVVFFDQSLDAKSNRHLMSRWKGVRMETPFLDSSEFEIKSTLVAMGPDTRGLKPGQTFCYSPFKSLDPNLFVAPRPISNQLEMSNSFLTRSTAYSLDFGGSNPSRNNSDNNDVLSALGLDQKKWKYSSQEEKWSMIETGFYLVWFVAFSVALKNDLSYPVLNSQRHEITTPALRISRSGVKLKDKPYKQEGMFTPTKGKGGHDWDDSVGLDQIELHDDPASLTPSQGNHARTESSQELQQKKQRKASVDISFNMFDCLQQRNIEMPSLVFKILLDICGTCGSVEGATRVLRVMARYGETPDNSIFACLFRAFAMDPEAGKLPLGTIDWRQFEDLERKEMNKKTTSSVARYSLSGKAGSETPSFPHTLFDLKSKSGSAVRYILGFQWLRRSPEGRESTFEKKEGPITRDGKEQPDDEKDDNSTKEEQEEVQVSSSSLLEYVFPGLCIEVVPQTCPANLHKLDFSDICAGWDADPNSYTTVCRYCQQMDQNAHTGKSHPRTLIRRSSASEVTPMASGETRPPSPTNWSKSSRGLTAEGIEALGCAAAERFVPRFAVRSSSEYWRGNSDDYTLFVEYLSPWTLYKELQTTLSRTEGRRDSVEILANLRKEAEVVYWNMVFWFSYFGLHTNFLSALSSIPLPETRDKPETAPESRENVQEAASQ